MKTTNFKTIFIALGLVPALLSCTKNLSPEQKTEIGGKALLSVTIGDNITTKVSGDQSMNDIVMHNAQVFVFNKRTGQIDNAVYKTYTGTSGSCELPALTCTFGSKEVWAIVNAPKDYVSEGVIKTLGDLKATTVQLSDNSESSLVMVGHCELEIKDPTEALTVQVNRLVAAVVLKSVKNEMVVPAYQNKLVITGAYLMNVPAVQRLDGSIQANDNSNSPTSSWNAFYKKAVSPEPVALLADAIPETSIAYGNSYSDIHTFYSFSNSFVKTEAKSNLTDKSSTYLVVECKVDGVPCVYPVVLPDLIPNNKYYVDLVVQHVGGDPAKPWEKVHFCTFSSKVEIVNWTNQSVPETI